MAVETHDIHLCGWFCEWEVVRTETDLCIISIQAFCNGFQGALQIRHGDALVNDKAFNLVEQGGVSGVHCV